VETIKTSKLQYVTILSPPKLHTPDDEREALSWSKAYLLNYSYSYWMDLLRRHHRHSDLQDHRIRKRTVHPLHVFSSTPRDRPSQIGSLIEFHDLYKLVYHSCSLLESLSCITSEFVWERDLGRTIMNYQGVCRRSGPRSC
jgi:hypothetical protein